MIISWIRQGLAYLGFFLKRYLRVRYVTEASSGKPASVQKAMLIFIRFIVKDSQSRIQVWSVFYNLENCRGSFEHRSFHLFLKEDHGYGRSQVCNCIFCICCFQESAVSVII
jgi:hypothetical protein